MLCEKSRFRIIERGYKETLLLIPGWATDYRIFDALDLNYNYLLPLEINPFDFEKNLVDLLEANSLDKISLFGCSLGGFLACGFASNSPEKVNQLILLGIRRSYDKELLQDTRLKLEKNKKAFLYKFYLDCFSRVDKQSLIWFKNYLLRNYLEQMGLECLKAGLDYLACTQIKPEYLAGIKRIKIFHGSQDKIAPLKGAMEIKSQLPNAEFISLDGLGHFLFLCPSFKEKFNE